MAAFLLALCSYCSSRVGPQVETVLDLFERSQVTATFFILGWVAERYPKLVRRIAACGHEIGCHSYAHRLVYDLSPSEFRQDTRRAVRVIEDACGVTPTSYRAPSYSITASSRWALDILVEEGFTHDSSIYPIAHDRYGIPGFYRHAEILQTASGPIQEVPIATVKVGKIAVTPIGGGGYLRLLPYCYTAAGIRRVNRVEDKPVCVYFHPWELDARQPRLASGLVSRMRTYRGLDTMQRKLESLLTDFRFSTLTNVFPTPGRESLVVSSACGAPARSGMPATAGVFGR